MSEKNGLSLVKAQTCSVIDDGKFTDVAPEYEGQWVKDADKAIGRRLREEENLPPGAVSPRLPFCER